MRKQRVSAPWLNHGKLRLRHLRLALAIDRFRNLQKAAQSIGLSQPAASRLLAELEQLLATPLFDRRARGLEPNRFGETFVRHVRAMLGELEQAGDEIANLLAGFSGSVAVGTIVAAGVDHVARAVSEIWTRHPQLRIRIEVATSDHLLLQVADGALDFAIARRSGDEDPKGLEFEALSTEELCVICRHDHPLAGCKTVALSETVEQIWVLQQVGTPLRQAFDLSFRRNGLAPPANFIVCASHEVGAALVVETNALSVVSRPIADLYGGRERFATVSIEDRMVLEPYGIVRRQGTEASPAANLVLSAIRQRAMA